MCRLGGRLLALAGAVAPFLAASLSASEPAPTPGFARVAARSLAAAVANRLSAAVDRLARVAEMSETMRPPVETLREWIGKEADALAPRAATAFLLDPKGGLQLTAPATAAIPHEAARRVCAALSGADAKPSWALVAEGVDAPLLVFVAPLHAAVQSADTTPAAGTPSAAARAWVGTACLVAPLSDVLGPTMAQPGFSGRAFAYNSARVLWSAKGGGPPPPAGDAMRTLASLLPLSEPREVELPDAFFLVVPSGSPDFALGMALTAPPAPPSPFPLVPALVAAGVLLVVVVGALLLIRRASARGGTVDAERMQSLLEKLSFAEAEAARARADADALEKQFAEARSSRDAAVARERELSERMESEREALAKMRQLNDDVTRQSEDARRREAELEASLARAGSSAAAADVRAQLEEARARSAVTEQEREALREMLDEERRRSTEMQRTLSDAERVRTEMERRMAGLDEALEKQKRRAAEPATAAPAPAPAEAPSIPDVREFLQDCWQDLIPDLQRRMLRYPTRFADGMPSVGVSPELLRDVLSRFARELAAQTPEGGLIELSAKWQSGTLELSLRHSTAAGEAVRTDMGADLGIPDEPFEELALAMSARLSVERQTGRFVTYRLAIQAPARA